MEKKLVASLSVLMLLMMHVTLGQIPLYTPQDIVIAQAEGNHWKICLAQNMCEARITGYLTFDGMPIPGTEFDLNCSSNYLIEPLGPFDTNFVFWKVWTPPGQLPTDIEFFKWIDINKDGIWDIGPIYVPGSLTPPSEEEPNTWYQHVETDYGPFGPWMVVVEVREQPYDEADPFFDWQLTLKQENANVACDGYFTRDGSPIPDTNFSILCNWTKMQCQVIKTPWCTVPNDIELHLLIYSKLPPYPPIDEQYHHLQITQFPWVFVKEGFDPFGGVFWKIQLELTEVQTHRYYAMGGSVEGSASFGGIPEPPETVPFHTRPQNITPGNVWQNITFTQRDPITGIVKLGVSAQGFRGIDHTFYSSLQNRYIRLQLIMQEQGCGYLFTGAGKNPILADVDILTWSNNTGVYACGPDHLPKTADDILIMTGPCLREASGPDGIPGTGDLSDIFGDGVPDPKGSSILYLPTTLSLSYHDGLQWQPMCEVPFPMLMTTSTASDVVLEPSSTLNGVYAAEKGYPWRYLFNGTPWEDPECDIKVTYACSWSSLNIPTPVGAPGPLDIILPVNEYKVREDRYTVLRGDSNCDQIVDFKDLYFTARRYGTLDEGFGMPTASTHYDARADHFGDGKVDIKDIVWVAKNYKYIHGYHSVSSYMGTIAVSPPSVTAHVGETFEVSITVSDVVDLYLVLFGIHWDPTVLNLAGVSQGNFPVGPIVTAYGNKNYTGGYLEAWTGTRLLWSPGSSGSGTIAKLQFEVVGPGNCALDLYDCSWMNSTEGQIGFTTETDGYFETPTIQVFPVIWKWLNTSKEQTWFTADVVVNSTYPADNFNFDADLRNISFDISSADSGTCNITLPKILMSGAFKVTLNGTETPLTTTWNTTHTSICFNYGPGTHHVIVTAEITIKIRGLWALVDVNGDGIVDIFDIVMLAIYFGWQED